MVEQETGAPQEAGAADEQSVPQGVAHQEVAPSEYIPTVAVISASFRVTLTVLSGLPLVAVGIVLYFSSELATWASVAIAAAGVVVIAAGLYFNFSESRLRLELLPGEKPLALRNPSVKPAFAQMIMSLPFFAGAGYLLLFTEQSYAVYYFALFLVAVYLYFRGIFRYWITLHTTYCVTNHRAVHLHRFAGQSVMEIPISSINSISETQSLSETLTNRGSVVVASGVADSHKVRMRDIIDPSAVAQTVRELRSQR